jgi:hypothetical protein
VAHGRERATTEDRLAATACAFRGAIPMQTPLMILFFITTFLAIFTPCVAYIHKAQHKKYLDSRTRQGQRYAKTESDAEWILNRRLME